MVIPKMINKFKVEYLHLETEEKDTNVPGGNFKKNLGCLFTIIDQGSEIYNSRLSNNSTELLNKLIEHNYDKFG